MLRSCKRIYNRKAVESWFERLNTQWENSFSSQELYLGRILYRRSKICAIELTIREAIIHGEREQKPEYAVIEWIDQKLNIRLSTKNRKWGYSLAIAGIYEIEELITEVITPISEEKESSSKALPSSLNTLSTDAVTTKPVLLLNLYLSSLGLTLQPFYQKKNNKVKVPLNDFFDGKLQCNRQEREQLIRLTAFIRKAGFVYTVQKNAYYLSSPENITHFLNTSFPEWQRYFEINACASLEKLREGVKEPTVAVNISSEKGRLKLDWDFRLGEKALSPEQKGVLLKCSQSPVFFSELGAIKMRTDQIEAITYWRDHEKASLNGSFPHYLIFSLFTHKNINVLLSQKLRQWSDSFSKKSLSTLPLPEFLRPYQTKGVEWLAHLCEHDCHPLLADEMGLGKTIQILALIAARPLSPHPHLIVCPASVIPVWKAEAKQFFSTLQLALLSRHSHPGNTPGAAIWLASYSQLRRQRANLINTLFGYIILDEAQTIKNPEAKTTFACLSLVARHRIAVTGTPIENTPLDLWTIFRFLMPGLLGTRSSFQKNLQDDSCKTLNRLHQQIKPFILRRTKQTVATELPPKVVIDVVCPLTELQRKIYQKIVEEGLQDFGNDLQLILHKQRISFFSLLTRLRQVSCDPRLLPWVKNIQERSGKLDCLWSRLTEIFLNNSKVVIFSQFVHFLEQVEKGIHSQFYAVPCFKLTGQTHDRTAPIKDFQETKGAAVILVSLKAGGTGITLNKAEYVFLLDPWWNPAVEEQAIDRVHRIGQEKRVFVYRLIAEGTIEERIAHLQNQKRILFRELIGNLSGKSAITDHYRSLNELIVLKENLQK